MRMISMLVGATLALSTVPALAADANSPAAAAARYSTSTTQMGVLLADPAAKAVLVKHIPQLVASPDMAERASGMTLREIQEAVKAYAPDMLSDKVLSAIDFDLAQVPVKN